MKTKTNLLIKLAVITCLTVFFSCKKKDTTVAPAPTTPMGTLAFHLHTNIDTTETDSGRICKDAGGRRFQLNVAQFYASGIVAIRSDGSKVPLSNVYILKTMAKEEYVIGSIPAGNYNSVSFNVGIDSAANKTAPSSHAAPSVLGAQIPNMWFGSTAQGYIFMNVQGLADTT